MSQRNYLVRVIVVSASEDIFPVLQGNCLPTSTQRWSSVSFWRRSARRRPRTSSYSTAGFFLMRAGTSGAFAFGG